MTFSELVESEGGIKAFATKHGFPISTIGMWYRSVRYPSPLFQRRLSQITDGQIDFDEMRDRHLLKKAETPKNRGSKRLGSNLPICNLSRLKLCFREEDLPVERLGLHGDRIAAMWAINRVTVGEFRIAVSALAAQGKDTGDIEQINSAVGNARTESKRRLQAC